MSTLKDRVYTPFCPGAGWTTWISQHWEHRLQPLSKPLGWQVDLDVSIIKTTVRLEEDQKKSTVAISK